MENFSGMRKLWFKKNAWKMIIALAVVTALFICYALSHNIIYDLLGIIIGFVSIIYFRNKWHIFVEEA